MQAEIKKWGRRILGDRVSDHLVAAQYALSTIGRVAASPEYWRQVAHLEQFRDRHRGERCVIIGNGPSLRETDMALLASEITFGLNRIYLMFDELGFATSYHVCINKLVIEQTYREMAALDMPRFLRWSTRKLFDPAPTLGFLRSRPGSGFADDIRHGVWEGSTVTYVAMQLAYFMGFDEVVLVGVDHHFTTKGAPHAVVEGEGDDPNHFDPNYFGQGFRWQLPDLEASEASYRRARSVFEADGRRVIDATVGGKLQVFPKLDLREALG